MYQIPITDLIKMFLLTRLNGVTLNEAEYLCYASCLELIEKTNKRISKEFDNGNQEARDEEEPGQVAE